MLMSKGLKSMSQPIIPGIRISPGNNRENVLVSNLFFFILETARLADIGAKFDE